MPNSMTSEYWIGDNPIGNEQPIEMADGCAALPVGSGLGLAPAREALEPWAGSR